MNKFIHLQKKL